MILLLIAAALACPNSDAEVERAVGALVGGDYASARAALASAAEGFACAAAGPDLLGRYWLVEGAVLLLDGDPAAARGPFAAARSIAPTAFDERLGPKVRAAWSSAASDGTGTLLLAPPHPAQVDGAPVSAWPTPVSATPHLVQVLDSGGAVRFGKLIRIDPGEDALVETGLPASLDPLPTEAPQPAVRKKSPALLVVAGVAAAGAGACAGGALAQKDRIDEAVELTELNDASDAQRVLGYSAWGLLGAAAVTTGLHFVLP